MDHESLKIIQQQKQKLNEIQNQLSKSQMEADRKVVTAEVQLN